MEQSDLSILVKWNISPHINKQECNSHQQFQAFKCEWELLKGKAKPVIQQMLFPPHSNSWKAGREGDVRSQKKKKKTQGCWPQVAEMNIKGMTNNPRHCISPYVAIIVQFKSCLILCNPTDGSTLGFPILNYLQEFAQIHALWVDNTI